MAILKCKMCGGDLIIEEGSTICVCEYCGSQQTVPSVDNEKKIKLYERANSLRLECEFDRAYGVYESITEDYEKEAEAYWGLVLCKYGIEYVDDPKTGKKIPTCHRSSFDSIFDDKSFDMVMESADVVARSIYREEAKVIEEIRKGIIEKSSKEEPYDIFICYKETDDKGERTIDSVLAQDIYTALTKEGYRVFFARITLESKLGRDYEPIIFSALHSSKVMLSIGTSYNYYHAVWVKNEWSRFLKMIEKGEEKFLIPCFKGIDAYDLPKEFKHLQAQDMGKVGAIQDLLRGIEKIIGNKNEKVHSSVVQADVGSLNAFAEPLIKRAEEFLKGHNFEKAKEFYEKSLEYDPKNEGALLGVLLAEQKAKSVEELSHKGVAFYNSVSYIKLMSCCKESTKKIFLDMKERSKNDLLSLICEHLEKSEWENAKNQAKCGLEVFPSEEQLLIFNFLADVKCKSIKEAKINLNETINKRKSYKMLLDSCSDETKKELHECDEAIEKRVKKRTKRRYMTVVYTLLSLIAIMVVVIVLTLISYLILE